MKISTYVEYQWNPKANQYELVKEEAYNHKGAVSSLKSAKEMFNPIKGTGPLDAGGAVNHILDPLDLFGGAEQGQAEVAKRNLPDQLSALNEQQARLSRYDTSGPFGESSWSVDPKTGRYTQTTNLNPSEQRQFDTRNQIAESMLGRANDFAPSTQGSFDYNKEVPDIANTNYQKTSSLTSPYEDSQQSDWQAKMKNIGVSPTSGAYQDVAGQRSADSSQANTNAMQDATTAAIPMAQQQRQQRMTEMAQLIGSQQLNSPAMGGNGIDVAGATQTANQVGIQNQNQSAAQRNANMNAISSLFQSAYPNGIRG